jgi:hypothetical protein
VELLDEPWSHRGYEHAAEVVAWALADRIITPAISGMGTGGLERAYRLLTDSRPPRGFEGSLGQ